MYIAFKLRPTSSRTGSPYHDIHRVGDTDVAGRYNYVRWIKSLLDSTSDDLGSGDATPARDVVGLDMYVSFK